MKPLVMRSCAACGLAAGPVFALAMLWFATLWPNYEHALYPPALLGSLHGPGATGWNLIGYGLVGTLCLLATLAHYQALRAAGGGRLARIGVTLATLAAIAFIAQGVFPLDIDQPLDVGPSRRHIAAWNLWWIAAVAAMLLTALGTRGLRGWRTLAPVGLVAATLVLVFLLADVGSLGNGWRQRIALAGWFGWLAWASLLVLRRERR